MSYLFETNVTVADEDTNSILTDNVNTEIQDMSLGDQVYNNWCMYIVQPMGDQICCQYKWRHLVAKLLPIQ